MATDRDDTDFDPPHSSSATDHVLTELQLYGHRPFQDEPDPRLLPEANVIGGAVADIFDALIATLRDTRLEPDLESLLWSTVNLFHRAADRVPMRSTVPRARLAVIVPTRAGQIELRNRGTSSGASCTRKAARR